VAEQFPDRETWCFQRSHRILVWVTPTAALFSFVVSALALFGTQFGIQALYVIPPGFPPIVPITAVGFMLVAVSLFFMNKAQSPRHLLVGRIFAWLVILLGSGAALDYALYLQFGLERFFLIRNDLAAVASPASLLVPMAAVNFILIGVSLLKLDVGPRAGRMTVSQMLALLAVLGPFVSLLGYVFGLRNMLGLGPYALLGIMSLPSALLWLVLIVGVVCSRLDVGVMKTLTQATAASYSLRRLLVPILLVPPLLVGMMEFGLNRMLYVPEFGSAVLAVTSMLFFTFVIWKTVSGMELIEEREVAARAARMRSDSQLNQIFELAPFGLVQADVSTLLFSRVNEAFCAMTGYSQDELLQMSFAQLTFEGDFLVQWPEYQKIISNGGGQFRTEKRYIRKDGEVIWVMVSGVAYRDPVDQKLSATAVVQDINQKKQEEQSLLDARAAADSANQMKTTFLANMSHELRTPLSAVTGFAELLLSEDLSKSEKTLYLSAIQRNGKALSRLIDDVLDLTKVEAGKFDVEKTPVSVSGIVLDVLLNMQARAREKGIEFKSSEVGNIPAEIVTDSIRLRQILLNVVGNAIKFTDKGTVEVVLRCSDLDLCKQHRYIEFWVKDSGRGLRPHEQDRIFKPFSQADVTTTRRYGGTGLGLALSQQLARALGGDVFLQSSEAGVGSVFVIQIPIGNVADFGGSSASAISVKQPALQAQRMDAHLLDGASILLAEDAPDVQLLVGTVLSRMGAKVTLASNGREAVNGALSQNVDLVLMDVQMPELDGYGATRTLRQLGFNRPIIALTANALKEDFERSLAAGCNGHLTKPISIEALGAVLLKHVSQAVPPPRQSDGISLQ
jgi:PAS domain S-box-containing protein